MTGVQTCALPIFIFGLPLVLNPIFFVPFILTPLLLTVISYAAIAVGLVPHTIALIPWTTPPIIGGFLATASWQGAVLSGVNLIVAIGIYLPFVYLADRAEAKREQL